MRSLRRLQLESERATLPMVRLASALALLLAKTSAWACRYHNYTPAEAAVVAQQIYIGRVASFRPIAGASFLDTRLDHDVTLLVEERLIGKDGGSVTFRLSWCGPGLDRAEEHQRLIVFQLPDGRWMLAPESAEEAVAAALRSNPRH